MLLILAEANASNTSGAYNEFPISAQLYAPLVLKALASASIKSISHPLVLQALAIHLF